VTFDRRALDSLFNTLKKHGASFSVEFWDTVCQELLFPIFAVLKSSQDVSRFSTQEDMSVWLSTTMIQALRDLIDLYTFYFDILERFLDGLLDLLCVCICQGVLFAWVPNAQMLNTFYRERHPRAHRHIMSATVAREQRQEAECRTMGTSGDDLRQTVPYHNTSSTIRRKSSS